MYGRSDSCVEICNEPLCKEEVDLFNVPPLKTQLKSESGNYMMIKLSLEKREKTLTIRSRQWKRLMQTVHFRKVGVFKHRPGDFEHIKERQDFNSERSTGVHPCISSVNTFPV